MTGAYPLLDTPEGPLFESAAIARYIARLRPEANLSGQNAKEQAEIDQWIDFTNCSIIP